MKKPTNTLLGMKEIVAYTGRDRATVIKWIESDNFPAVKIDGRWESNTDLVDDYRRRRIEKMMCCENGSSELSNSKTGSANA